jgi:Zn-dependent metalloprotease
VTRTTAAVGAALALTTTTLAQVATAPPTGAADTRGAARAIVVTPRGDRALARLSADARGPVRVTRGDDGVARVVDVAGARNPAVTRSTSPRSAARAHLARYGALVGVADRGTRLVAGPVTRSVTGDDVVRFTERRHGLPVIGGGVAVDLRPDRQLGSVTASVSRATVPGATYSGAAAQRDARAAAVKRLGAGAALTVDAPVRRLYDPAVLGVPRTSDPTTHARGVWWVEVHAGPAFHRLLLVDDRTGAVVLDVDLVEQVDRVVCDNHNFNTELDLACQTAAAARTEGDPPTGNHDVDSAYALAGVVSTFYHQIGGIDLTRLLGVDEGDHKSLSSTVRWCDPGARASDCPLRNAFWNGIGMFYGQGFASADDVVGHEMTHGVISHNSDLLYWGQSGAINESLADVMGEIIDHRHHSKGESRQSWALGEDLPVGAIRNIQSPRRFGQPESMTSRRYAGGLLDNGGVHTNSGVGNRTFYLISQGGHEGGHRVRGIDGRSLQKSATLYLAVIQHLVSGSDYADLAAVLDQSCRALARHHRAGTSKADCRNVHRATLATGLRTTPPRAKQPPDARLTCPRGSGPVRVLFDSEKGTPTSEFDAGSTWLRAPSSSVVAPVPANATSGRRSWYSFAPEDFTVSSLTMHPVALPAGRRAYLWFQQWRLLEFGVNTHTIFDGGTVEVADTTRGLGPQHAEGLPWVNGPRDVITDAFANPAAGRRSFGADSRGYLASRLALKRFAGHAVSPRFTMNTDNSNAGLGWYLDDVRVYTCGRAPVPRSTPRVTGDPTVGSRLTATPGQWSPSGSSTRVHWYADGEAIAGATGTAYVVQAGDVGRLITVKVTARSHGRHGSTFSPATGPVAAH